MNFEQPLLRIVKKQRGVCNEMNKYANTIGIALVSCHFLFMLISMWKKQIKSNGLDLTNNYNKFTYFNKWKH